LEILTNWGEAEIVDDSQENETNLDVGLGVGNWARVGLEVRLEVGNCESNDEIKDTVAMETEEMEENRVSDWFRKPENAIRMEEESPETSRAQTEVCAEIQEDGARVNVVREERLSRMERRRKEWEGKMISRKIIIELVEGVNRQIVIAAMEGIIDEVFEGAAKE
jgi:hypothetical protein